MLACVCLGMRVDTKDTPVGTMVTAKSGPEEPSAVTRFEVIIASNGGYSVNAYRGKGPAERHAFGDKEALDEYLDGLLGVEDED